MYIRKANMEDRGNILAIYAYARKFMKEHGNAEQWGDVYPPAEKVEADIRQEKLYVCIHEETIAAVFYYAQEDDEDYRVIEGAWLDDRPYGVVHRIASAGVVKGAASFCLEWAYRQAGNLRIDTHVDNKPMQSLLHKLGFTYCGRICPRDAPSWMAYQKNCISVSHVL